MKKYRVDQLRNVAIISHGGAGKTTLAEAMLFLGGAVDRFGRVDDGTSTMDYDPDEVKRKISINASVAPVEWNGHKINLIDTPGYSDLWERSWAHCASWTPGWCWWTRFPASRSALS